MQTHGTFHIKPEKGFTSGVIKEPNRFVGRKDLLQNCIRAINTPNGLIGIYGKRGVSKSSLARQIQEIALGNYPLFDTGKSISKGCWKIYT